YMRPAVRKKPANSVHVWSSGTCNEEKLVAPAGLRRAVRTGRHRRDNDAMRGQLVSNELSLILLNRDDDFRLCQAIAFFIFAQRNYRIRGGQCVELGGTAGKTV